MLLPVDGEFRQAVAHIIELPLPGIGIPADGGALFQPGADHLVDPRVLPAGGDDPHGAAGERIGSIGPVRVLHRPHFLRGHFLIDRALPHDHVHAAYLGAHLLEFRVGGGFGHLVLEVLGDLREIQGVEVMEEAPVLHILHEGHAVLLIGLELDDVAGEDLALAPVHIEIHPAAVHKEGLKAVFVGVAEGGSLVRRLLRALGAHDGIGDGILPVGALRHEDGGLVFPHISVRRFLFPGDEPAGVVVVQVDDDSLFQDHVFSPFRRQAVFSPVCPLYGTLSRFFNRKLVRWGQLCYN